MSIGTRPKAVDVSIQDNTNPVVYSYAKCLTVDYL